MLVKQIVRAQQGCSEDMEALVEKFGPILRKYSRKLFWEDALSDMTVAFIELIYNLPVDHLRRKTDEVIVSYIAKSVYNTYIALLNGYFSRPQPTASLDEVTETLKLEAISHVDKREKLAFQDLLDLCPKLTDKERTILTAVYYWGYTSTEIADQLSTSKQNINQIKLRALRKICRAMKNR